MFWFQAAKRLFVNPEDALKGIILEVCYGNFERSKVKH